MRLYERRKNMAGELAYLSSAVLGQPLYTWMTRFPTPFEAPWGEPVPRAPEESH